MSTLSTRPASPSISLDGTGRTKRRWLEPIMHALLLGCAAISVATTAGIVGVLLSQSLPFFSHVSLVEFFTAPKWAPQFQPQRFGIMPLVCGTLVVAGGSALIAIPIGLGTAVFLSEYARPWFRHTVKPLLEILA
ncbi:MAG: phosphate ABC transporter permease subunit PstC, partial [Planctomycetales bacterium]|nr:phosphate ABC transporter permease subunit PstC [Planctomycetales bacterium]